MKNNAHRDSAINTHTQNIRAGLPVLKTRYGMTMDEYDYLDIAVDALRDIRNFGLTEYLTIVKVGKDGIVTIPCNLDYIDAVTSAKTGLKTFNTRVRYEMDNILHMDRYYQALNIMNDLNHYGHLGNPGLADITGDGYISYHLISPHEIKVQEAHIGRNIAIAYTGISVDEEGFPLINRKQANAIAAQAAKVALFKAMSTGSQIAGGMMEFVNTEAARLKQAASIPEDITDNEIDEMLDATVTFNRKTYRRPSRYGR